MACVWIVILNLTVAPLARAVAPSDIELSGISVQIDSAGQTAGIEARLREKFELQIIVQPKDEHGDLTIRVNLPETGPQAWPAERVQVLNEEGSPLPVSRSGIQWHSLKFVVPPVPAHYFVRAQFPDNPTEGLRLPSESERIALDLSTGLSAKICRWFDGKRSALSLRFDDSHPTHLSIVVPLLDKYGFRGTFMINPGRSDFQSHRAEWEVVAQKGRHEFANHTMRHRGAASDSELEREIGNASEYIWSLAPDESRLIALNIGGATTITTSHPLQYFLDQYHVFPVWGSLGMDDVYRQRTTAFRRHLENHIERGLWCKTHFHSVGLGLATSAENFIATMEIVEEFSSKIWVTGLANAFKYQEERSFAKISLKALSPEEALIEVTCLTDPALYDHPLTLEVELPEVWNSDDVSIIRDSGSRVQLIRESPTKIERVLRFHVPPVTGRYFIHRKSNP